MSATAPRPPDWRHRAWARARRAVVVPITPGAKRAVLTLLVVTLALSGANLLFTAREVNAVRAAEASAARSTASVVQLCQAGNESRAQQVTLWDHLVAVAQPPPHETSAQARARLAVTREFLAYVHKVFAPQDCTRKFS